MVVNCSTLVKAMENSDSAIEYLQPEFAICVLNANKCTLSKEAHLISELVIPFSLGPQLD